MTTTKPRSALLCLALTVLTLAGLTPAASAGDMSPVAELQAAAPAASPVVYGPACPDVMVIGARGAGEAPSGVLNTSAYTSDTYHGAGKAVFSLYQDISSKPGLSFSLYPVVYPADPIFEPPPLSIVPNPNLAGDARFGAKTIATDILTTDIACGAGKLHYILAGYSLGAWAVQDSLKQLTKAQLPEITGIALFGNPLFVPFAPVVRDNQSSDRHLGLGTPLDLSDLSIPGTLVSRTGSWCFSDDPVCQAIPDPKWPQEALLCSLNPSNPGLCAHANYPGIETAKAAAFLQPLLPPIAPATPGNITAAAQGQYTITVTWTDDSANVTGFNVDNGCPVGSCDPGATLARTTGPVHSTTFTVTPGTYQCFRVQAISTAGTSPWSDFACTGTPGLVLSATQQWTNTGVTVPAGDELGITAGGQITISPTETVSPGGDPSCTPAQNFPGATFPATNLPCYSLIARIGNGAPFEVGTSDLVSNAAAGVLYLGINDDSVSGNSGGWNVNIKLGGLPPGA